MQSHSCTGFTSAVGQDDTKHGVARTIFAQKFLAPGASHTPVVVRQRRNLPPDSQGLVQLKEVNLMKLRHKAVPGDPKDRGSMVPIDQRLHATVRLEVIGKSAKEITLWFRKVMWIRTKPSLSNAPQIMVAGRALDLVVQHFGISHTPSVSFSTVYDDSDIYHESDILFEAIIRGVWGSSAAESFGIISATRGWIYSCVDRLTVRWISVPA